MKNLFKMKKIFLAILALTFLFTGCDDNDDAFVPESGTLTGGPFLFGVNSIADYVSGIEVTGNIKGKRKSFIITDESGVILGMPLTIKELEEVDFDATGIGVCLIWYIVYEVNELEGLEVGKNASEIKGIFDLSNSIKVERVAQPVAGTLTGGPFTFTVGDGTADNISGVTITGPSVGENSSFIITDDMGGILELPEDIAALEAMNFDGAGVGKCYIWYIRYQGNLEGLEKGKIASSDISGLFSLSNSIEINRN